MLVSYLRLARPANMGLVVAAVLLGATVTGASPTTSRLWQAALGASFAAAAGYVVNDLRDVRRDRMNKPWRPLPAGSVERRGVVGLACVAGALGWGLAWMSGWKEGLLVTLWYGLLAIYEAGAKERMLWGNLIVSGVAASAVLLGGLAVDRPGPALIPAAFAFLYHLGREIWKDVADVRGDRSTGALTLAVVHGPRVAMRGACLLFGLLVILSPLPYVWGLYNGMYLAVVLGGVDLLLVGMVGAALIRPSRALASRTEGVLKLGLAAGLCAMALGSL